MKKVKFLRVPSGSKVRGIYAASSSGYIIPGEPCNPNEGGGFIGDITFEGGFLHFRKVDKDGKPLRDFGVASIKGDRKAQIVGDAVAVSADGFVIVFDDEDAGSKYDVKTDFAPLLVKIAELEAKIAEQPVKEPDPPPAKPIQGQQRR